jgi:hypothetical protein
MPKNMNLSNGLTLLEISGEVQEHSKQASE